MDDRKILELYPLPIARGYRRYRNATEVRERHDAAYYLFEVYLKYVASVAIARYLSGKARDHKVNAALKGLARPSLGEWLRFLRECLCFLKEEEGPDPAIQSMTTLFESKEGRWGDVVRLYNSLRSFRTGSASDREKVSLSTLLEEVIPYRNRVLGHGAPLETEHYQQYGELLGHAYPELLQESAFLTARRLVSFESPRIREGSRVECGIVEFMGVHPLRKEKPLTLPYGAPAPNENALYLLSEDGSFLALDPLLLAQKEDVYILNEVEGTPEYLSYATGERHRPSGVGEAQQQLFERILGYRVDSTRLSHIGEDLAKPLSEEKPLEEEQRLGDYRIVREIGRGGMGTVFEAIQESLGRRVALKVLPGTFALDPKRLERFRREARATARIHHPNIVPVYEVGEAEGNHYYAMEYIDGPPLDRVLDDARRHSVGKEPRGGSSAASDPGYISRGVEQLAALAEGLEEAHRQGLIHRDVKPSNILVDPAGRWVLVDFGLVREEEAQTLTRSGEMIGTLAYMSPEQVSRRRVDARSDVYSLGATLYEVLTLKPPFPGESDHAVQNAILFEDPARPRKLNSRLNQDVETVILHALEKNPEKRYPTAKEFAADLKRFLRYEPIHARPASAWTRISRRIVRHKGPVAAAAVILVLLASIGFLLWKDHVEWWRQQIAAYEPTVRGAIMKIEMARLAQVSSATTAPEPFGGDPSAGSGLEEEGAELEDLLAPIREAVEALGETADVLPEKPDAYYIRARGLLLLGRGDEALGDLERALGADNDFVPALVLRATVLKRLGEEESAKKDLDQLAASLDDKGSWAKAYVAARRAFEEGLWEQAAKAYGRLARSDVEPFIGAAIEARLGGGLARLEAGQFDEALIDFSILEDRFRSHGFLEPTLLRGKAYCLRGEKGDAETAEETFTQLYRDRPRRQDEIALRVGAIYYRLWEYTTATEWLDKAPESAQHERLRCAVLQSLGRYDEAIQVAKGAVELDRGNAEAHRLLATAWENKGRREKAKEHYREALQIDPDNVMANLGLGVRLRNEGDLKEARKYLERAVAVDARTASVSFALLLEREDSTDKAEDEFRRAILLSRHAKQRAVRYRYLGRFLRRQGDLKGAADQFRQAIAEDPTYWRAYNSLRFVLGEMGKREEAVECLQGAVRALREPRDKALCHETLGKLHLRDGKLQEAEEAFRNAFKTYPSREHEKNLTDLLEKRGGQIPDIEGIYLGAIAAESSRERRLSLLESLGSFYRARGDLTRAIQQFEEIRKEDPNRRFDGLGFALQRAGKVDDAFAEFCRTARDIPAEEDDRGDYRNIWSILRRKDRSPSRADALDQLLEHLDGAWEFDENGHARRAVLVTLALGCLYHPLHPDPDKALRYARLAVDHAWSGKRRLTHRALAEVLAERGDLPEAVRVLESQLGDCGPGHPLRRDLETYRGKLEGYLPSFPSVEAALAAAQRRALVAQGARWRYLEGRLTPPKNWISRDFDDSSWKEDKSGFGYGDNDDETVLPDMMGNYTQLYVRKTFPLPEAIERLRLVVFVDDGYVAWLNGEEVGRERAGHPGEAVTRATEPTTDAERAEIVIDTSRLRSENCLAILGLNHQLGSSDFSLIPILEAELPHDPEKDRRVLEAFRRVADPERDRAILAYTEGRVAQRTGEFRRAAESLAEAASLASDAQEPSFFLAGLLGEKEGDAGVVALVERALEPASFANRPLWASWARLRLRELPAGGEEALRGQLPPAGKASVKPAGAEQTEETPPGSPSYRDDLLWILGRFRSREPIRINCGGREHSDPDGTRWKQDRFFTSGRPSSYKGVGLYDTARSFPIPVHPLFVPAYRIPLPNGTYRVTLHFSEFFFRAAGERRFGVTVEGQTWLTGLDIYRTTGGRRRNMRRSLTVPVRDHVLDVEFSHEVHNPKLSAIEVEPVVRPDAPRHLSPEADAVIDEFPLLLQASPYRRPAPEIEHLASRWQIREDTTGRLVLDVVSEKDLERISVSRDRLLPETTYLWRVAYLGANRVGSGFSVETPFTTAPFEPPRSVPFDLSAHFNCDVVADPGDDENNSLDSSGGLLIVEGFDGQRQDNPAAKGLPADRNVKGHVLGDYALPNALQAGPGDEGEVRVEVPKGRYSSVRFLVAGGYGDSSLPLIVEYADGTRTRSEIPCENWFDDRGVFPDANLDLPGDVSSGALPVLDNLDRLYQGRFQDANDPALFDVFVDVDPEKEMVALVFQLDGATYGEASLARSATTRFNLLAATGVEAGSR